MNINQTKSNKRGGRREGAGRKHGSKAKIPEEFKERWRSYSEEAIQFYRRVIASKTETIENKFRAATELLDRTWGRPSQEVTVNRDTNVSVKIETFEEVQRGLQDFGLDIHGTPLKLLDLSKNEDDE